MARKPPADLPTRDNVVIVLGAAMLAGFTLTGAMWLGAGPGLLVGFVLWLVVFGTLAYVFATPQAAPARSSDAGESWDEINARFEREVRAAYERNGR